jgi:hypothetical protein
LIEQEPCTRTRAFGQRIAEQALYTYFLVTATRGSIHDGDVALDRVTESLKISLRDDDI